MYSALFQVAQRRRRESVITRPTEEQLAAARRRASQTFSRKTFAEPDDGNLPKDRNALSISCSDKNRLAPPVPQSFLQYGRARSVTVTVRPECVEPEGNFQSRTSVLLPTFSFPPTSSIDNKNRHGNGDRSNEGVEISAGSPSKRTNENGMPSIQFDLSKDMAFDGNDECPNAMAGVSAIAAASLRSSDNVVSGHLAGTPVEIREEDQSDALIRINVSGTRYITHKNTLQGFPNTLLGSTRIEEFYNEDIKEYFFDRNRIAFDAILYYYQSGGYLYLPPGLELNVFHEELNYFEIPSTSAGDGAESEKDNLSVTYPYNRYFLSLHYVLDHPDSGICAKIWMVLDVVFIVISMTLFIAETDPKIEEILQEDPRVKRAFFYLDTVCIIFFTIDLLLRLIVAPDKKKFFKRTLNWLDFAAILPFYIEIPLKDSTGITALRVLRLFRVLRILKVIRHSKQLILILQVLKQSCRELLLLVVMWAMGVVTFGSIMYYIEEDKDSGFTSILKACWWAVVTMSTVGYGDIYPKSVPGKLVGSVVVFLSMVFMALPMTIIVSKFSRAYEEMKEPGAFAPVDQDLGSETSVNARNDIKKSSSDLENVQVDTHI